MNSTFLKNVSIGIMALLIISATLYSFFRPQVARPTVEVIEETIESYLMENPDVIIKALDKYQENQRVAQQEDAAASIEENYQALINDNHSAVLGNPEGDITVVEFFDYACGYCKKVFPNVVKLIENDKNVRVVMKEFPILGVNSSIAAKAAVAVNLIAPDKYLALHAKLMEERISGEESVLDIVEEVGLDRNTVKAKMESEEVMKALEENITLARSVGVNGTPAFVIGKAFIPGAVDYSTLESIVASERK